MTKMVTAFHGGAAKIVALHKHYNKSANEADNKSPLSTKVLCGGSAARRNSSARILGGADLFY